MKKQQRVSKSRKAARAGMTAPRAARPSAPAVDGLTVLAGRTALRVVDHHGTEHTIDAGESLSFRPASVAVGEPAQTEIPGFRQAPPSSVLWLEISGDKAGARVTLDASGLLRNAARWGRPAILAWTSGAEAGSSWVTVRAVGDFALKAGARILVVGVGHGMAADPAGVFSSLLQAVALHRRAAPSRRESADGE